MSLPASRHRHVALLIRIGLPRFDPNYDTAGNLVDDHRAYSYTYDHDNRITKVSKSGAVNVDYQYDALGRRIMMVDYSGGPYSVVVRYYLHSGQNVVAEYDHLGSRLRYYAHGATYIDERVVLHDGATDKDYIYLTKDLYTVAGLADERGWLVESYDYDAYGQPVMSACAVLPYAADYDGDGRSCGTAKRFASRTDGDVDGDDHAVFESHQNGPGNAPSGTLGWRSDFDCDGDVDGSDYVLFAHAYNGSGQTPRGDAALMTGAMVVSRAANPYFFTGRRLDVYDIQDANTPNHFTDDKAGLVLYYYRARTVDPVLGRFLQRDPAGYFLGGMSLYEYGSSVPTAVIDPYGLKDYRLGTTDPPIRGDPGAGGWNSEEWTLKMWALKKQIIAWLLCVQPFLPNAAAHLLHYFENSGSTYTINLADMTRDVPAAKRLFDRELGEAKAFVESLPLGRHHITSGAASGGYNRKSDSLDWYYAVGGYSAWGKGPAKVECINGKRCYSLDFEYTLADQYNWDRGKLVTIGGVVITDDLMGTWHRQGLAKEFAMRASLTVKVSWCDDQPRPSPPGPPGGSGPGR